MNTEPNLSFYSNCSLGFFKKNSRKIPVHTNPFYAILDSRLHEAIITIFRQLQSSPLYQSYTEEEARKKYEQYRPLIQKLFALGS